MSQIHVRIRMIGVNPERGPIFGNGFLLPPGQAE
jgi:hypothetical protein